MTPTCEVIEGQAAELALGLLSGTDRADALRHLSTCARCRQLVEDLARVADSMLLLAPEAEPPVGFEARVLDGLEIATRPAAPARSWWRSFAPAGAVGIAAVALAVSLVAGSVLSRSSTSTPKLDRQYVAALHALGGSSLRAALLRSTEDADAGEVFLYRGRQSWAFVDMHDPDAADGQYRIELIASGGPTMTINGLLIRAGAGSVGESLEGDLGRVTSVVVRNASGAEKYSAQLPPSS